MENSVRINSIFSQIATLDFESRLQLVEKIIKQMVKAKTEKKESAHSLLDLKSLDSSIWQNIDINEYVENERKWD